ncbi:hypothetical protein CDAR_435691 [Caerostris darwini]|uniref:Uncharacterized protein n=1 Tax=Caerostris darwini TaxID=1538125 RepID=A0AAV4PC26_9ARAC|nr:hypothetical protein CDAR_435691 [Caerostris darwini]
MGFILVIQLKSMRKDLIRQDDISSSNSPAGWINTCFSSTSISLLIRTTCAKWWWGLFPSSAAFAHGHRLRNTSEDTSRPAPELPESESGALDLGGSNKEN